jgi:hypothetical protein
VAENRVREDDRLKGKIEIARNSIIAGLQNELVQITGLTIDLIQEFRAEINK